MYQVPGEQEYGLCSIEGMNFRVHQNLISGTGPELIDETEGSKYKSMIEFPTALYGIIIGKKKSHIMELRSKTKTKIFAMEGEGTSFLRIEAPTQELLDNATQICQEYVTSKIESQPFTHFIAVPCISSVSFVNSARDFLKFINTSCHLNAEAYDNLYRLHLTLLTLRLLDEDQIQLAKEITERVIENFDWTCDHSLKIAGVNSFGSQSEGVRLYFAQPAGTETVAMLKDLQKELGDALEAEKIDIVERSEVFHITLLRNSWIKSGDFSTPKQLEKASEFPMNSAPCSAITLCKRYLWKKENYYYVITSHELKPVDKVLQDE